MEKSMIAQRIATFKAFGETLKAEKVAFRDDWEVFISIQGKMFGMMRVSGRRGCDYYLKNLLKK